MLQPLLLEQEVASSNGGLQHLSINLVVVKQTLSALEQSLLSGYVRRWYLRRISLSLTGRGDRYRVIKSAL